jgi:hypothetical protein
MAINIMSVKVNRKKLVKKMPAKTAGLNKISSKRKKRLRPLPIFRKPI